MSVILPKGTEYPCKESRIYTTVGDYQSSVMINIYEGEDTENIKNDYYYDQYEHTGIEKNRAHIPKIEVTFHFDKNRVLHVDSKDLRSGTKGNKDIHVE